VRAIAVDALLAATVVGEALCVLGLWLGATVYDRLHYAGATTSVPPFLVFQAPDVALSALVVSAVAYPLVLVGAIARIAAHRKRRAE
jgi:hypothetical protein